MTQSKSEFSGDFSSNPEQLAKQVFMEHGGWILTENEGFVEKAAGLHNSGEIDLFAALETKHFEELAVSNFFDGQHFYNKVIPLLSCGTKELMKAVKRLVEKAGEDGAANEPNAALREWLNADMQRAETVVRDARAGDELAVEYVAFAYEALGDVQRAIEGLKQTDERLQLGAITALGRIESATAKEACSALETLQSLVSKSDDDRILANVINATLAIAQKNDLIENTLTMQIVERCAAAAGDFTKNSLASCLWQHAKTLGEQSVSTMLNALHTVNKENAGTVRQLDHALGNLFKAEYEDQTTRFFVDFAKHSPTLVQAESFPIYTRAFLQASNKLCGDIFTAFLLSGEKSVCAFLAEALSATVTQELDFDLSGAFAALSVPRQIFVARKAVGYLFVHQKVTAQFLIAATRVSKDDVTKLVSDLLFDPMAINFGAAVPEVLDQVKKGDAALPQVRKVKRRYKRYREELKEVGVIKELQPTESQRQVEGMRVHEMMRDVQKQALEKSVFFGLVSHSNLLYGRAAVLFADSPSGERKSVRMEMQSHEHGIELPRQQIFDPFGLDYMLRVFRTEQLTKS